MENQNTRIVSSFITNPPLHALVRMHSKLTKRLDRHCSLRIIMIKLRCKNQTSSSPGHQNPSVASTRTFPDTACLGVLGANLYGHSETNHIHIMYFISSWEYLIIVVAASMASRA